MARLDVQGKASSRRRSALVAAAISFIATTTIAGESQVVIGEVSGTTASGEYKAPLFLAVRETLDQTKLGRPRERYVLSASLVALDAQKDGKSVSATAVVSLVLRREKEHTLHAMLRGSARAVLDFLPAELSARLDRVLELPVRKVTVRTLREKDGKFYRAGDTTHLSLVATDWAARIVREEIEDPRVDQPLRIDA